MSGNLTTHDIAVKGRMEDELYDGAVIQPDNGTGISEGLCGHSKVFRMLQGLSGLREKVVMSPIRL